MGIVDYISSKLALTRGFNFLKQFDWLIGVANMDSLGAGLISSKEQCVGYIKLDEFVGVDGNSSDTKGNIIPEPGLLRSLSNGARSLPCRADKFFSEKFSGISKKEFADSIKSLAVEVEPFAMCGALVVLYPVGVVVAAGIGLVGVPVISGIYGIYGGLYLGDRVYTTYKPESNHGLKWSENFANLFETEKVKTEDKKAC